MIGTINKHKKIKNHEKKNNNNIKNIQEFDNKYLKIMKNL